MKVLELEVCYVHHTFLCESNIMCKCFVFSQAEKKKQLEEELIILETKNRKRSLGNIRFIGELFKLKMLSETIMHECVVRLLRSSSDEESLECFAGLITTTGKDLDKPEAKVRLRCVCEGCPGSL